MHDFSLAKELYNLVYIGVVGKPQNVVVCCASLLFCCLLISATLHAANLKLPKKGSFISYEVTI